MPSPPPPVSSMSLSDLLKARDHYQGLPSLKPKQVDRLIEIEGELSKRGDEVQAETLRPGYPWGDT